MDDNADDPGTLGRRKPGGRKALCPQAESRIPGAALSSSPEPPALRVSSQAPCLASSGTLLRLSSGWVPVPASRPLSMGLRSPDPAQSLDALCLNPRKISL